MLKSCWRRNQYLKNQTYKYRTESNAKLILCLQHYAFLVLWENSCGKKAFTEVLHFPDEGTSESFLLWLTHYHHALPLIIPHTSQSGGTTMTMRWALAGFVAVRKKAASHISQIAASPFAIAKLPSPCLWPGMPAQLEGGKLGRQPHCSQPALPSPGSLQETCSVKVRHRELDRGGVLFVTMQFTTLSFAHMQPHLVRTPRSTRPTSKETVTSSLKGPWKFEVLYLTTAKIICLCGNLSCNKVYHIYWPRLSESY